MISLQSFARSEAMKVVRFVFVGGMSFLVYLGLYTLFSRVFFPEANRTLLNFTSNVFTAIFNFLAHRWITFQSQGKHRDQIPRYLFVLVSAMALQSALFWVGNEVLKVYDIFVAIGTSFIVPVYTYSMHRWWTFRPARELPAETETEASSVV
jgi:putative flippase GtrA